MGSAARPREDLPAWLWAGFPPLMLALLVVLQFIAPQWIPAITRSDHDPAGTGLAEHATVAVLIPGIAAGFAAFGARSRLPDRRLGWWVLMWTLACVYFVGEELSWGQRLAGWQTPDALQALNRQGETNLHNITSWLDRKPRAIVEIWILAGGLALPLWRWCAGRTAHPERATYWLWPTAVAVPSAALFFLFRAHKWYAQASGREIVAWLSESEVREYYVAVFLSLYLASIWWRLRRC